MLNIKSQLGQLSWYMGFETTFEIMFPDTLITHFGINSIVVVQRIVIMDDGVLVAALHIDVAVLGVVVCCLAKLVLNLDDQEDLRMNFYL